MIAQRIEKIRTDLKSKKLDAALISSPYNIIYLTNFAGFSTEEREAFILITKDSQYIFTDGRYTETIKIQVEDFELVELTSKFRASSALKRLALLHHLKNVGIEEDDLTVTEYQKIKELFKTTNYNIENIRTSKDETEIESIQSACLIGDELFEFILKLIKPGISEQFLAWEMEQFTRKRGATFSFDPIVAFNQNSAYPHHLTSQETLEDKSGQLILLDFGVKFENYCSDITRVVFLGKATSDQKKIYQTVAEAQLAAVEKISAGIKAKQADTIARKVITDAGFPEYQHGLGHGIGLEVHEAPKLGPTSKDTLENNMVFSVEPGIYLPGVGGVRIEDLYQIVDNQPVALTKAPKELIEL